LSTSLVSLLFRIALVAVLAFAVGCGGGEQSQPAGAKLPSVSVDDLAGGKVSLSSLVPAQKPLLVWAWSPI
jgi:hypothetical protein